MSVSMFVGPYELKLSWDRSIEPTDFDAPILRVYYRRECETIDGIDLHIEAPVARLAAAPAMAQELARNWRIWTRADGHHVLQIYSGISRSYALEAEIRPDFRDVRLRVLASHRCRESLQFLLSTVTRWLMANIAPVHGGFLLHGAAVARADGKVIVASGPSGAGKSTFATFYAGRRGYRVLTDETALVLRGADGRFKIYGTPWHGMAMKGSNSGGAPAAMFFLEQTPRHQLREIPLEEAALRLVREIFLPPWNAETTEKALEAALAFLGQVPFGALGFRKARTVVDFIEEKL